MNKNLSKTLCALFFSCWSYTSFAIVNVDESKPFLHPIFSNGMVIQQNEDVLIWGWAKAGTPIKVELASQTVHSKADENGKWQARLLPIISGNVHRLHVSSKLEQATVSDIQIGEVWLCSGQSNMFWPVVKSDNADSALANANNPSIRLFNVDRHYATTEQSMFSSHIPWKKANADTIKNFSAVCYFFGQKLQQELNVPVGLIHASWGGTKIEAWTDNKTLQDQKYFTKELAYLGDYIGEPEKVLENLKEQQKTWWQQNDSGSQPNNHWSSLSVKSSEWKTMTLPNYWEEKELPSFDGVVWFRKSIFLDENTSESSYQLSLGMIDDADVTWVNGVEVGSNDKWNQKRQYNLPKGLLKEGENTIAVRVFDKSGNGGFYSTAEQLFLMNNKTSKKHSLAGDWNYQVGRALNEMTPKPQILTKNTPTVLFNSMIAPLVPYKIRGVVWYQGESNTKRTDLYQTQLTDMIRNWREVFDAPLAFHIVQLANYVHPNKSRDKEDWPKLREAQRLVAKQDPLIGIASTIDIGEPGDIHPTNKLDVGNRLARSALHITYNRNVIPAGPEPISANQHASNIVIRYNNVAQGLKLSEGKNVSGFETCITKNDCEKVQAYISGEQVILKLNSSNNITSVRYGWAANPSINLINSEYLPAIPFTIEVSQNVHSIRY